MFKWNPLFRHKKRSGELLNYSPLRRGIAPASAEEIDLPCEKKLVFSAEKFYGDNEIPGALKQRSALDGWPERCDGKTEEECNALGYWVHPDQMEER